MDARELNNGPGKGASYVVGGPDAWRQDCCESWPKPCRYHEGYIDAMDAAADEIERLRGAMNFAVRNEQEWKAALVRYGHHAGSCLSGPTCYCGWEELAKKLAGTS